MSITHAINNSNLECLKAQYNQIFHRKYYRYAVIVNNQEIIKWFIDRYIETNCESFNLFDIEIIKWCHSIECLQLFFDAAKKLNVEIGTLDYFIKSCPFVKTHNLESLLVGIFKDLVIKEKEILIRYILQTI